MALKAHVAEAKQAHVDCCVELFKQKHFNMQMKASVQQGAFVMCMW